MPDLTLIEKLRQIASAKKGDPMPECLRTPSTFEEFARDPRSGVAVGFSNDDWGTPLSAICKEAQGEIERLRGILRCCMAGKEPVDMGDGETIGLYLIRNAPAFGVDNENDI